MITIDQIEYIELNSFLHYRSKWRVPTTKECLKHLERRVKIYFKPANIERIQEAKNARSA